MIKTIKHECQHVMSGSCRRCSGNVVEFNKMENAISKITIDSVDPYDDANLLIKQVKHAIIIQGVWK